MNATVRISKLETTPRGLAPVGPDAPDYAETGDPSLRFSSQRHWPQTGMEAGRRRERPTPAWPAMTMALVATAFFGLDLALVVCALAWLGRQRALADPWRRRHPSERRWLDLL